MKSLYFVRHGQTEWNAISRMQGQWNSDLNETGKNQAEINGAFLSNQNIDVLLVSPLDRTRQTAEIINQHLNLQIAYDDRIMEWDCGDWSGYLYAKVKVKWAEEWRQLEANRFHYRGPNCENYPDMISRCGPFLKELKARPENNIVIVSHGMIGRVMVAQLLGFDEKQTLEFHQPNDVIFRVTLDDDSLDKDSLDKDSLDKRSVEVAHFVGGEGPIPGLVN